MSCFSPCDSRTDGVLRLYLNRALWGYPKLVDMVFGSEALHTAREERKKERQQKYDTETQYSNWTQSQNDASDMLAGLSELHIRTVSIAQDVIHEEHIQGVELT